MKILKISKILRFNLKTIMFLKFVNEIKNIMIYHYKFYYLLSKQIPNKKMASKLIHSVHSEVPEVLR